MMTIFRNPFSIVLPFICLWTNLYASGDAGQPGAFLRYGVGVRALAMGRAQTASVDDASSIYWNPAGLLESEHKTLSSMYANLYYDSRYAFIGVGLPRLSDSLSNPVLKYLFGPQAAWGMGWIGFSMVGFEQRTAYNEYLGNFDLGENAWLLSWAREHAGQWGVFRYGLTCKYVRQQFPGIRNNGDWTDEDDDGTGGLDFGMTFQPIHMPGFRIISLRYLLPLRLGMSIQNWVQPAWDSKNQGKQKFPRVLRYGVSYRWHMQDWIPDEWPVKSWMAPASLLMVYDYETFAGAESGAYWGVEATIPMLQNTVVFLPRFGSNNRSEGPAFGFGMRIPFSRAAVQLDYAHQQHDVLPNDARFNISLQLGPEKGAAWFRERARNGDSERTVMAYRHLVLSKYPNSDIAPTVQSMSDHVDRAYERRLNAMVGGMRHAALLLEDARTDLKEIRVKRAKRNARDAASEFSPLYLAQNNQLNDTQSLDYGEALLISENYRDAVNVLKEVENRSLRYYFLLGTAYKGLEDSRAVDMFNQAVRLSREEDQSMVSLAYLSWAEALVRGGQYKPAITALNSLLGYARHRLNDNYPRLPILKDGYLQDDAMFLLGIAELKDKRYEDGVSSLFKTLRYFPSLEYGGRIEAHLDEIALSVKEKNVEKIQSIADALWKDYSNRHHPSNNQVHN